MKIVIDIPDDIYNEIKEGLYDKNLRKMAIAIGNGTPLPKGHGRLGDIDALEKNLTNGINAGLLIEGYEDYGHINNMDDCVECVKSADTIVEADNEVEST